MCNEALFCKTLRSLVRLRKAINLGLPGYCIDKLDNEMSACFDELEANGLVDDFLNYVL